MTKGLNAAVNKLREALGDSAESPRFIQTLPRRGYRFIAPVQAPLPASKPDHGKGAEAPPAAPKAESGRKLLLSDTLDLPPLPGKMVRLLFCSIQFLYLGFYVSALFNLHRTERMLTTAFGSARWVFVLLMVLALVGIPIRLYLLSAALLRYRGLAHNFRRYFVAIFIFDELWAFAPLVIAEWIGMGLALAAAAVLVYLPFSQRSLLLMPDRVPEPGSSAS